MRKINLIVVHCTATPEGRDVTVNDVRRWHLQRGFKDVGYHYLVRLDGSIEAGRCLEEPGAHCRGHNRESIGVCYVGGCDTNFRPKATRTPQQRQALVLLLRELKNKFPGVKIAGHRDYAAKACPSFDATREYRDL